MGETEQSFEGPRRGNLQSIQAQQALPSLLISHLIRLLMAGIHRLVALFVLYQAEGQVHRWCAITHFYLLSLLRLPWDEKINHLQVVFVEEKWLQQLEDACLVL